MASLTAWWSLAMLCLEVMKLRPSLRKKAKRVRIRLDLTPEFGRRLGLAASIRGVTVRQYVLEAIERQLNTDLGRTEEDGLPAPTAKADPVLAGVWADERDSAYDRL